MSWTEAAQEFIDALDEDSRLEAWPMGKFFEAYAREIVDALELVVSHDDEEDEEGNFVMRFNHDEMNQLEAAMKKARG